MSPSPTRPMRRKCFFTFYLNVARLRIRKLFWYQVLQKVPYPKLPGIGMNYPRLGTGTAASLANTVVYVRWSLLAWAIFLTKEESNARRTRCTTYSTCHQKPATKTVANGVCGYCCIFRCKRVWAEMLWTLAGLRYIFQKHLRVAAVQIYTRYKKENRTHCSKMKC